MSRYIITRAQRVRRKLKAVSDRPRLSVLRTNRFLSTQLIDDTKGVTLAAAHEKKMTGATRDERIANLGKDMAEQMKKAKVTEVYFDRGGYAYHGTVAKVADALRENGIKL